MQGKGITGRQGLEMGRVDRFDLVHRRQSVRHGATRRAVDDDVLTVVQALACHLHEQFRMTIEVDIEDPPQTQALSHAGRQLGLRQARRPTRQEDQDE